jgi:hypothetical protein
MAMHESTAGEAAGPQEAAQDAWTAPSTRRGFLKGAAVVGAGTTGLGALGPAAAFASKGGVTKSDLKILGAA